MKARVAILLESSLEVSRRILSGIVKYMDRHEPWTIDFVPGALCEQRLQTDDPTVIAVLETIRAARGFDLRAAELARGCEMSLRHLENKFQKAIGRSISDILHETCLENVMELVERTDIPFKDIAAKAGHRSVPHLAGIFKARFGVTMSEARARRNGW